MIFKKLKHLHSSKMLEQGFHMSFSRLFISDSQKIHLQGGKTPFLFILKAHGTCTAGTAKRCPLHSHLRKSLLPRFFSKSSMEFTHQNQANRLLIIHTDSRVLNLDFFAYIINRA